MVVFIKGVSFVFDLTSYMYRIQCCGAKTICFRSGSDFQKVSAPTTALELPVITDFTFKSPFFMFFMKENLPNSHARSYSL